MCFSYLSQMNQSRKVIPNLASTSICHITDFQELSEDRFTYIAVPAPLYIILGYHNKDYLPSQCIITCCIYPTARLNVKFRPRHCQLRWFYQHLFNGTECFSSKYHNTMSRFVKTNEDYLLCICARSQARVTFYDAYLRSAVPPFKFRWQSLPQCGQSTRKGC